MHDLCKLIVAIVYFMDMYPQNANAAKRGWSWKHTAGVDQVQCLGLGLGAWCWPCNLMASKATIAKAKVRGKKQFAIKASQFKAVCKYDDEHCVSPTISKPFLCHGAISSHEDITSI